MIVVGFGTENKKDVILVTAMLYNGSEAEARKVYRPLLENDPIHFNTTKTMSFAAANNILIAGVGNGIRRSLEVSPSRHPSSLDLYRA